MIRTGSRKKVLASCRTDSGQVAETEGKEGGNGQYVMCSMWSPMNGAAEEWGGRSRRARRNEEVEEVRDVGRRSPRTHDGLSAISIRTVRDDPPDIILEPLIQHPIRLVQHKVAHAATHRYQLQNLSLYPTTVSLSLHDKHPNSHRQIESARVGEIQHPPRRTHDDPHLLLRQQSQLLVLPHPTKHAYAPQPQGLP